MKTIVMALILALVGPMTTGNSQNPTVNRWWSQAETLGKKTAQLKQERYEGLSQLTNKLLAQAEIKSLIYGVSKKYEIYEELRRNAALEFAVIHQKYDQPIIEAQKAYFAHLQTASLENQTLQTATQSVRPIILYQEKAKYTEAARQNRVQGSVILSGIFGADGRMSNIESRRSLPDGLTEEAQLALQELIFLPAQKDGKPVSVRISVEFTFNLL